MRVVSRGEIRRVLDVFRERGGGVATHRRGDDGKTVLVSHVSRNEDEKVRQVPWVGIRVVANSRKSLGFDVDKRNTGLCPLPNAFERIFILIGPIRDTFGFPFLFPGFG